MNTIFLKANKDNHYCAIGQKKTLHLRLFKHVLEALGEIL